MNGNGERQMSGVNGADAPTVGERIAPVQVVCGMCGRWGVRKPGDETLIMHLGRIAPCREKNG